MKSGGRSSSYGTGEWENCSGNKEHSVIAPKCVKCKEPRDIDLLYLIQVKGQSVTAPYGYTLERDSQSLSVLGQLFCFLINRAVLNRAKIQTGT